MTPEQIKDEASHHGFIGNTDQLVKFARAIEAEARAQALSEAYDLLFDVKGSKATRFDAQNAIRELAAPVDVQAWVELARARRDRRDPIPDFDDRPEARI